MGPIVARECPRCGAPVSTTSTLSLCEFCGASLLHIKPTSQPAPQAGGATGVAAGALLAVAVALVAAGGIAAALLLGRDESDAPPSIASPTSPPPSASVAPPDPAPAPTGESAQAGVVVAMLGGGCDHGEAQQCVALGVMFEQGASGVAKDPAKARAYYGKACALGDKSACSLRDRVR